MFRELKARRVARRLVAEFPEIDEETARDRARRRLSQYPTLPVDVTADSLIYGERTARLMEQTLRRRR